MRFTDLEIKEIWAVPEGGFVRAMVGIEFSDDSLGAGDMPVMPTVRVHPFIKHDGTATLDTLEAEFLDEARRLLTLALQAIDGKSPQAIRREVETSKAAEEARQKEIDDAEMEAALQNLQQS